MRRILGIVLATLTLAVAFAAPAGAALPPINHVWIVVLENKGFDETFGPSSPATYLNQTLRPQGQLLTQYYGTAHNSLPNYIAMVSGQGPNILTQADCQFYMDVLPGIAAPDGQVIGQGCVYPTAAKTIADQLGAVGRTWHGYFQDMGTACRHPVLNSQDSTQSAHVGDQYAARHNPFVYFHSIIDSPACAANVVDLSRLDADLAAGPAAPAYNLVVPNLCEDGHDAPCVDGRPGGLRSADAFLQTWVPKILGSPAYADNGLVIVTFDEAESGNDASSCCGETMGYNTINPGGTTPGTGGGRTGAVLVSPFITPGTTNATAYNHYSLLRSTEDLFGLSHLAFANQAGLTSFGSDVFHP